MTGIPTPSGFREQVDCVSYKKFPYKIHIVFLFSLLVFSIPFMITTLEANIVADLSRWCSTRGSEFHRYWDSALIMDSFVEPPVLRMPMPTEKVALALQATHIKNMSEFIVQAIRENYQDPVAQAQFQERKHKEQQAMLDALKSEMSDKRNALLRQAVRTNPKLLEQAAEKIQSHFVRERLASYNSLQEAYRDGGMVTAEINAILAADLCADFQRTATCISTTDVPTAAVT